LGKPQIKISLGGLLSRWVDNIKMDFRKERKCGIIIAWIHMVEFRDCGGGGVMKTKMNLCVL
jgi:hypothetical protein